MEAKRLSIPAYSRLRESGVYPGIDIVYYETGREIEYDFEVAPGADASRIRMRFDGADHVSLNDRGELVLALGTGPNQGSITQRAPSVYQRRESGEIVAVNAHYRINRDGSVGVDLAGYDRAAKLIVDPTITYSAYLSGSGTDEGVIVTHDAKGLVYMAGDTVSNDFPLAGNSAQEFTGGSQDVWLMILDPSQPATAIQYATYLGGGADEFVKGMVIDQNGVFYVTGSTDSGAFPVTASAITSTNVANTHGFVSMIDPSQGANGLIYSRLYGRTQNDEGDGIAVANGKIYSPAPLRRTISHLPNFVPGHPRGRFRRLRGRNRSYAKWRSSEVVGTYLGGANADAGHIFCWDANGLVYVSGTTYSTGFPITGNAYQPGYHGGGDGFLAVLNLAGRDAYVWHVLRWVVRRRNPEDDHGSAGAAGHDRLHAVVRLPDYAERVSIDLRRRGERVYLGSGSDLEPAGRGPHLFHLLRRIGRRSRLRHQDQRAGPLLYLRVHAIAGPAGERERDEPGIGFCGTRRIYRCDRSHAQQSRAGVWKLRDRGWGSSM